MRAGRPFLAELHYLLDTPLLAFNDDFNPAIRQVPNPPCEAKALGEFGDTLSEENTLNSATDVGVCSRFHPCPYPPTSK